MQVPDAIDMGTGEKCVMKAFKSGGVYEDTFFSDDIKASVNSDQQASGVAVHADNTSEMGPCTKFAIFENRI